MHTSVIQILRDIALAVAAGAAVVESSGAVVSTSVDNVAIYVTLAAHVLLAALNAYQGSDN